MNNGFIAFTTLLIISAVALASVLSISLLGIGEARSSLDFKKAQEARIMAESCAYEALYQLRNNSSFVGSNLNINNNTCTMSVSGSGSTRTVNITSQVIEPGIYQKMFEMNVNLIGNSVSLIKWKEVN